MKKSINIKNVQQIVRENLLYYKLALENVDLKVLKINYIDRLYYEFLSLYIYYVYIYLIIYHIFIDIIMSHNSM